MIKRLVIQNCIGLEELAFNPGKVNIISGGNEKGKTTILESIEKVLFNTKRRAKFVRLGAEKAYIELDTDDGINIKRTVLEDAAGLDKGKVKVSKDGQPQPQPESFLKELFGVTGRKHQDVFAFNPVDFMQKQDSEQTDILLGFMPIRVSAEDSTRWFGQAPRVNYEKHGLQVLKDLEQWFYDGRREANAKVKATEDEAEAVAKRLPDNYQLEDWEKVSLATLFDNTREAEKSNSNLKDCRETLTKYHVNLQAITDKYSLEEREVMDQEVKDLKDAKQNIEDQKAEIQKQVEKLEVKIADLVSQKGALMADIHNLDKMKLDEKEKSVKKISKVSL